MSENKSLQVREKQEVSTPAEQTRPGLVFTPAVVPSIRSSVTAHQPEMTWGFSSAGGSHTVLLKIVCSQIIADMELVLATVIRITLLWAARLKVMAKSGFTSGNQAVSIISAQAIAIPSKIAISIIMAAIRAEQGLILAGRLKIFP